MNFLRPTRDNDAAVSHTQSDKFPRVFGAVTRLASIADTVSVNKLSGISPHSSVAASLDYVDTVPFSTAAHFDGKPQARSNPLSGKPRKVVTTVHPHILRGNSPGASNPEELNEPIGVSSSNKSETLPPTDAQEQWNDLLIQSALRWQNQRARKFGMRLGIGSDGHRRFNWDNQTLEIDTKNGEEIVCPATVIGTHYIKSKLFVCGWMDRKLPLNARQSSSSLLAKVQAQDIGLFESVAKECDDFKVWGLAAVAARVGGFDMVCRGRVEKSWMYLSIVVPDRVTGTKV